MNHVQSEKDYLVYLISTVLNNTVPCTPAFDCDWNKLYIIARQHNASNIAYYAIKQIVGEVDLPPDAFSKFEYDYKSGIAKEATQHIEAENILKIFEERGIECIPLKGYVLKHLYPKPDMRLMTDIDMLVKQTQMINAKSIMLELGYSLKSKGEIHDVYYKKPFMNVQIHKQLFSEHYLYSEYFSTIWETAVLKTSCSFIYELTTEDFYIYMLAHIAKHYYQGGTGIRSVVDVWVYNKEYFKLMDWNYTENKLSKIGLLEFTNIIRDIGQDWIDDQCKDKSYEHVIKYILSSGIYGTLDSLVLNDIINETDMHDNLDKIKCKYLLKRMFPPIDHMKLIYPKLTCLPFMLPMCWILRGFSCMIYRHKRTIQILKIVLTSTSKKINELNNIHKVMTPTYKR